MPNQQHQYTITSVHEFVSFLFSAFDLRDGRQHQLKELRSPDELAAMINKMVKAIAKHIAGGREEEEDKLCVIVDFMNLLLLHFNRSAFISRLSAAELHQIFVADVLIELFRTGLSHIATEGNKQGCEIRSDSISTHLAYMLIPDYLSNARGNFLSGLEQFKQHFKRGYGGDIKQVIRQLKSNNSEISLDKINKICDDIESDRTPAFKVHCATAPLTEEIRAFFHASIYAEHVQKHITHQINLQPNETAAFKILTNDAKVLLKKVMNHETYRLEADELQGAFDNFVTSLTRPPVNKDDERIINTILNKQSSLDINSFSHNRSSPFAHFTLNFERAIEMLKINQLDDACCLLQKMCTEDPVSIGGMSDSANKFYVALLIKRGKLNVRHREHDKFALRGFLSGSYGFTFDKSQDDAFHYTAESIFSLPSSIYVLSAIQTYAEIIEEYNLLDEAASNDIMIQFPQRVELALEKLYQQNTPLDEISLKNIKKTLRPFTTKNCISFIPKSSLYNCLSELSTLCSFWPEWEIDRAINVKRFCNESIITKRKVLLALSVNSYRASAELNANETITIETKVREKSAIIHTATLEIKLNFELDKFYYEHVILSQRVNAKRKR